jgi:hypothetical protein
MDVVGNRPLGRLGYRWADNTKTEPKDAGWDDVN